MHLYTYAYIAISCWNNQSRMGLTLITLQGTQCRMFPINHWFIDFFLALPKKDGLVGPSFSSKPPVGVFVQTLEAAPCASLPASSTSLSRVLIELVLVE